MPADHIEALERERARQEERGELHQEEHERRDRRHERESRPEGHVQGERQVHEHRREEGAVERLAHWVPLRPRRHHDDAEREEDGLPPDHGTDVTKPGTHIKHDGEFRGMLIGEERWKIDDHWTIFAEVSSISDPNFDFFYGSICANADGDVVIGYSKCGLTENVSAYASVGSTTAGVTTFASPMPTPS